MCRLVPFWLRILEEEHISARAVLVVRPPFDVTRSLLARDNLPLPLGGLLWLRHVLEAEFETRAIGRTWAPYADTLRDWRQTLGRLSADLGEAWPVLAADASPDSLVKPALQHHSGAIDTSRI